ncbi:MAG: hypothetical protein LKF99_05810 [Bifidobacterium sp.]|nr:hypothetical protein [Bifidobacterium sp.]
MVVLTTSYVALSDHDDLETMASEAYDLALQALIDNYRDREGVVYCRFRLLSGEPGTVTDERKLLWSNSEGATPADSLTFGTNNMSDILADPRWTTNKVRMYWVSVVSGSQDDIDTGEYESETEWVVEYFDEQIPDDPEPNDPAEDECFVIGDWNPWPLTSRTRFVLWQSLICLNNDLQQGLADRSGESDGSEHPQDSSFMQEFPSLVKAESRSWWNSLQKSCIRLIEAMRTGEQWNPRTPGEEALILVACGEDRLNEADFQIHENTILLEQFETLPVGTKDKYDDDEDENSGVDPDFDWCEVPNALAGDGDIAILWDEDLMGVESPDDMKNQMIGMGDYRAEAWHKPFDRYQQYGNFPSTLF